MGPRHVQLKRSFHERSRGRLRDGFIETAARRGRPGAPQHCHVPKTCQNGHQPLKFSPSVPEKGIFGHGISGIEDIAVDQPEVAHCR